MAILKCNIFGGTTAEETRRAWLDSILSTNNHHTVALLQNGTVKATKYLNKAGTENGYDAYAGQCEVHDWTDIVAVSAGDEHTVGLKADGTVVSTVCTEDNEKTNVDHWEDIVAVSAGASHTLGLQADGTVVAVGSNIYGQCNVENWADIVKIAAGPYHSVGLRADGTVVATGQNDYLQCDLEGWSNIIAISAGCEHTLGLRADGTVVATNYLDEDDEPLPQNDVAGWTDIVAISAGYCDSAAVKSDGTVVYAGDYDSIRDALSQWHDIVAIAYGLTTVIGLTSEGTVVSCSATEEESNEHGEANVQDFRLFDDPESAFRRWKLSIMDGQKIAEERRYATQAAAEQALWEAEELRRQKINDLTQEQIRLQNELSNLKGIFSGKRRRELELQIAAIDEKLKGL